MSEQNKAQQAKKVYNTLCRSLDSHDWHYTKNEEKLSIECKVQGEDLPIDIVIKIIEKNSLVTLLSHMPFVVQENKRLEMAVAISAINNLLVDGCFDYDVKSGNIFFRMTHSFLDSQIDDAAFSYMFLCSCGTIDEYNDKLLMLTKGMISMEKFLKDILKQ